MLAGLVANGQEKVPVPTTTGHVFAWIKCVFGGGDGVLVLLACSPFSVMGDRSSRLGEEVTVYGCSWLQCLGGI
jgi:hypothetical protein